MTEILLLGTFHFRESSVDICSEKVQDELDRMVRKLAEFCPNQITIEAAYHQQKAIDQAYQKFQLEDLKNWKKMQTENLGPICSFGETHSIGYNNESIQIGFRMGKILQKDKIHAVDIDMDLGENVGKLMPYLEETIGKIEKSMREHTSDSIVEQYKYYNTSEWSRLNHNIYIRSNSVILDGEYTGATVNARWYERNLKIFANIQRMAEQYDRLFVLYGSGHLQILRDLINADEKMKLADVYEYL